MCGSGSGYIKEKKRKEKKRKEKKRKTRLLLNEFCQVQFYALYISNTQLKQFKTG